MKAFFKKYYVELVFVTVMLLCAVLIVSTIVLLDKYNEGLEDQARNKVSVYATDTQKLLQERTEDYVKKVEFMAREVSLITDRTAILDYFYDAAYDPFYGTIEYIRFFKDGQEYDSAGMPFEMGDESKFILDTAGKTDARCAGIIYYSRECKVAYSAPVADNAYVDSIVVFYSLDTVTSFGQAADDTFLSASEMVGLCTQKGEIIEVLHQGEGQSTANILSYFQIDTALSKHENILDRLYSTLNDKSFVDEIDALIFEGKSGVYSISINGDTYVLSVSGVGERGGRMFVFGLYRASAVYDSGYNFANTMLSTLIVCFIILFAAMTYFIVSRRSINKKIFDIGTTNATLDCPTMVKFDREAKEILDRNKATKFAVIVAEVRFYTFIIETFGDDAATKVLQYMKVIYSKSLQTDEIYAYINEGAFALLFHYKDQTSLLNRLKGIYSVAYKYPGLRAQKYNVKLHFGIYEVDRSVQQPIQNMVDKAVAAKNSETQFGLASQFKFYTEKLRESYIKSADIEVRMENALKNDEFKVFFQPKYNIAQKRQDGCEALVRWYDPDTNVYRRPDTFLPLFEANGFITEVDRYVYLKVCEYIGESVARGQSLYPVSINVSRITATQPDFIEYYSRIKRQYQIADRFLTLEFTESFAYENYDALKEIISALHKNGFQCSIDDFGSGYSSYNILKALPMDEIKLDRFFIEKGLSEERDNQILLSVINIAKELKMKVTQEGVETKEDLERLLSLGCEVIQGYLYSKPLPMVDYISFVNDKEKSALRNLLK